ncbi:ribonuclease E activity regulator RraA [Aquibacillus saliphilus]|uniref:ribonuclease E activity regulator RraA n=1 Tax=Aquibacillus saliphilus TaxID=1909422 RepID=UPI001CF0051D|nr:ribonuclease E activity regulator RraA [Aquibacillus saliphilus]
MHTADLCDEHRDRIVVADSIFQFFGKKNAFHGPIYTLKVYEDNLLVRNALRTIPEESVLVIDGGGSRRSAIVGDNLAEIAVQRKLAGMVINGCIRDSHQINEMDVGIYALGTNPIKSKKQGLGYESISVGFAGVNFTPGSFLYADRDGIVVAKHQL